MADIVSGFMRKAFRGRRSRLRDPENLVEVECPEHGSVCLSAYPTDMEASKLQCSFLIRSGASVPDCWFATCTSYLGSSRGKRICNLAYHTWIAANQVGTRNGACARNRLFLIFHTTLVEHNEDGLPKKRESKDRQSRPMQKMLAEYYSSSEGGKGGRRSRRRNRECGCGGRKSIFGMFVCFLDFSLFRRWISLTGGSELGIWHGDTSWQLQHSERA